LFIWEEKKKKEDEAMAKGYGKRRWWCVRERKKEEEEEGIGTRALKEGGREREVGNRWRKMWQRRVIAERIERVQLHLMEGKRGVIAREGREKETQHIFGV